MLIKAISVYNLRSIVSLEDLDLSNGLDILIGQNDTGKSTILTGLDVFFDLEKKFNFQTTGKNDLSYSSKKQKLDYGEFSVEEDEIAVLCKFTLSDDDLSQEKCLLRNYCYEETLTILKKSCAESRYATKTPTKRDTAYYVLKRVFQNGDFNDLDQLDEKALIVLMEKYSESSDHLVNVNETGKPENVERINALLQYAKDKCDYQFEFEQLKSFPVKGSPDPIWPEFSLIDTNTALDGKNKIIDDAFKIIDNKIEQKHKAEIDTITTDAKAEYKKITEKITKYAQEKYLPQLESFSAQPSVTLSVARDLVMKRLGQTENSHFSQQGDGTKRRMMVAILQVSADVVSKIDSSDLDQEESKATRYLPLKIWAFDEPEMHLHPGAQRDLYESFENFKKEGFQIICSTHSTVFVNNAEVKSTHLITLNDNHETIKLEKTESLSDLIKSNLGVRNSDAFFSNIFVVLEGDTEVEAFPIFYQNIFNRHYTHDDISIVSKGGWTKSKNDFEFLHDCLGDAVCLFDNDVSSKVGIAESDMPSEIKYIGKATIEDSFSNNVWLPILKMDYDLKDLNSDNSIWSDAVLNELRKKVEPVEDRNKKFFSLLESHYQSKYRELKPDDFNYPSRLEKKELGRKLAEKSIELDDIPQAIQEFLEMVAAKL